MGDRLRAAEGIGAVNGRSAAIAGARDPSCRRRSCRKADIHRVTLKTASHAGIEVRAATANRVLGHPQPSSDQKGVHSRWLFTAPST